MAFLRFLETIRSYVGVVFDPIFSLITYIGDETLFLIIAILFFWCVSKREGYYILVTGVVGTVINQWLKLACKVPRPWMMDPPITPVEGAVERAGGYSFPSGHTQNVTGTFGAIAMFNKQKWIRIACIVIIALVSFSRMYLGVHTPLDVAVGMLIAAVFVVLFYFVFRNEESQRKFMDIVVILSVLLSIGFIVYTFLQPTEGITEEALENLNEAKKNASTLIGCLVALVVVYPLDKFVIHFDTSAKWYSQIIKLSIGVGIDLLIRGALKQPLNLLFGNEYIARAVRYFLIVVFSGAVWPLTFNYFKKLEIPCMERFTEWLKAKFKKAEAPTEK